MLGYSFVRHPEDVEELQRRLSKLGRSNIGIILKIETEEAFSNLPMLVVKAMRSPNIGLMIARVILQLKWDSEEWPRFRKRCCGSPKPLIFL